uniref:Pleckstrin homology domain containing, family B (evectins) member 2 n=1 Tax=Oryzias latipes TaxID=8090 RepID=A0A3P9M1G1_ORYLA
MAVVKSGWLHRQSTILRRWKRNWFDLWADGRLVFYNDQQRRDMEDDIHMRVSCINIRNSAACQEHGPWRFKMPGLTWWLQPRRSASHRKSWNRLLPPTRNTPTHRFTLQARMEIIRLFLSTPHRLCTLLKGHHTPLLIRISTKVSFYTACVLQLQMREGGSKPGPLWCFPGAAVNHVVIRERQREDAGDVALGMLAGAATGLALGSLFSVF